jgi:hypothetical protein
MAVEDLIVEQGELLDYRDSKFQTDMTIGFSSEDSTIKSMDFYLFFPPDIFEYDVDRSPSKCSVMSDGDGCVLVTSDIGARRLKVPIRTVSNGYDLLVGNTNVYELFAYDVHAYDEDGNQLHVNIENGSFKVVGAESEVDSSRI